MVLYGDRLLLMIRRISGRNAPHLKQYAGTFRVNFGRQSPALGDGMS
ncbi:hypothetical protein F0726_00086 [Acidithiobacillus caldus]|nr:hypothetical protein F0726_00086 [Acidithiobacillus caldus]